MPSIGRIRYLEAVPPPSFTGRPRGVLLLLHAFPVNARMWEPQLAMAAHGWRVIAPHMRGMDGGASDPPAASIDDYTGDVIDLLDGLHVKDAVIGGLSMGGYVAFSLFRVAPHYFHGLILADTRTQADTPEGLEARRGVLKLIDEKGAAGVADEMIPKLLGPITRASQPAVAERVRELTLANPPAALAGAVRVLMSRRDSTDLLSSIRVPTLILVGDDDGVTPPANAEDMHTRIAGSELVRIPQAGHLSSLERPEAFNAALARFLDHRV